MDSHSRFVAWDLVRRSPLHGRWMPFPICSVRIESMQNAIWGVHCHLARQRNEAVGKWLRRHCSDGKAARNAAVLQNNVFFMLNVSISYVRIYLHPIIMVYMWLKPANLPIFAVHIQNHSTFCHFACHVAFVIIFIFSFSFHCSLFLRCCCCWLNKHD